jgi:hypothetical protein
MVYGGKTSLEVVKIGSRADFTRRSCNYGSYVERRRRMTDGFLAKLL